MWVCAGRVDVVCVLLCFVVLAAAGLRLVPQVWGEETKNTTHNANPFPLKKTTRIFKNDAKSQISVILLIEFNIDSGTPIKLEDSDALLGGLQSDLSPPPSMSFDGQLEDHSSCPFIPTNEKEGKKEGR